MANVITNALEKAMTVQELRELVSQISLVHGLRFVSIVSAKILSGQLQDEALANSMNVSLLAKAFALWAPQEGGRPLKMSNDANDEGLWLLRACNSFPWYEKFISDADRDEKIISFLVQQAYIRHAVDDPLDAKIGRAWVMFHHLVREGGLEVPDPSGELEKLLGVTAEELWLLGTAIWANQVINPNLNSVKWVFQSDNFVGEGPNKVEVNNLLSKALNKISLQPPQFAVKYDQETSKYRDPHRRDHCWNSEFNILRDFPAIEVAPKTYSVPIPTFALTRALDGFHFDLVEEFAKRKRERNAPGNSYDNEMSQTLGILFQRYVGRQMNLLDISDKEFLAEFKYGSKKALKDSPDWILSRPHQKTVLIECKARQPTLDVQRYGTLSLIKGEVKAALGKACRQLARFVDCIDRREEGLERFFGQEQFIGAVVMLAPLPFHMIPDIRALIEQEASAMEPLWPKLRNRLTFVPMSIRELETLVATEFSHNIPIETLLEDYARYREQAKRIAGEVNGIIQFPDHLEEFLQRKYNHARRIVNPLCQETWNLFTDYCQRRIFGEGIEASESAARHAATARLAFAMWKHRKMSSNEDWKDWFKSERLLGF